MFGMAARFVVEPRWGSIIHFRSVTQGAPAYRRPWALVFNAFGILLVLNPFGVVLCVIQSQTYRSSISTPYFLHNRRNSSWNDSRLWCSTWLAMYWSSGSTCDGLTENAP